MLLNFTRQNLELKSISDNYATKAVDEGVKLITLVRSFPHLIARKLKKTPGFCS
jgi:hypothetical protein